MAFTFRNPSDPQAMAAPAYGMIGWSPEGTTVYADPNGSYYTQNPDGSYAPYSGALSSSSTSTGFPETPQPGPGVTTFPGVDPGNSPIVGFRNGGVTGLPETPQIGSGTPTLPDQTVSPGNRTGLPDPVPTGAATPPPTGPSPTTTTMAPPDVGSLLNPYPTPAPTYTPAPFTPVPTPTAAPVTPVPTPTPAPFTPVPTPTAAPFTPVPTPTPAALPNLPPPEFPTLPSWAEPTAEQARSTPGYQFGLQEGEGALNASAAAKGVLNTGGTLEDVLKFGQNYADQNYQTVRQNLLGDYMTNTYNQYVQPYQAKYASWSTLYPTAANLNVTNAGAANAAALSSTSQANQNALVNAAARNTAGIASTDQANATALANAAAANAAGTTGAEQANAVGLANAAARNTAGLATADQANATALANATGSNNMAFNDWLQQYNIFRNRQIDTNTYLTNLAKFGQPA